MLKDPKYMRDVSFICSDDWQPKYIKGAGKKVIFCQHEELELKVMITEEKHNGYYWRHISVSRFDQTIPTYTDVTRIKSLFVGDDQTAIQVFPKKSEHFTIKETEVLHLFVPLQGQWKVDFRRQLPDGSLTL